MAWAVHGRFGPARTDNSIAAGIAGKPTLRTREAPRLASDQCAAAAGGPVQVVSDTALYTDRGRLSGPHRVQFRWSLFAQVSPGGSSLESGPSVVAVHLRRCAWNSRQYRRRPPERSPGSPHDGWRVPVPRPGLRNAGFHYHQQLGGPVLDPGSLLRYGVGHDSGGLQRRIVSDFLSLDGGERPVRGRHRRRCTRAISREHPIRRNGFALDRYSLLDGVLDDLADHNLYFLPRDGGP